MPECATRNWQQYQSYTVGDRLIWLYKCQNCDAFKVTSSSPMVRQLPIDSHGHETLKEAKVSIAQQLDKALNSSIELHKRRLEAEQKLLAQLTARSLDSFEDK